MPSSMGPSGSTNATGAASGSGSFMAAGGAKETEQKAKNPVGGFSQRQTNAPKEGKQPAEEEFDMLKRRKLLFEDDSSSEESSDIEMSDWIVCASNSAYDTISVQPAFAATQRGAPSLRSPLSTLLLPRIRSSFA